MTEVIRGAGLDERRFGRLVLALVATGFAALLAAGLSAALLMQRGQASVMLVEHTFDVERQVVRLRLSLEEMRSARRGVVLKLRHDSGRSYGEAVTSLKRSIANVLSVFVAGRSVCGVCHGQTP